MVRAVRPGVSFTAAALAFALGGSAALAAEPLVFRVPPQSILGSPETPFGETTAAIHPRNPRRLLAGAIQSSQPNRVAVSVSEDGGRTWSGSLLPLTPGDTSHYDPYAAWTADGTAWVGVIASTEEPGRGRFHVFRSDDGGASWVLDGTPSGDQIADRSAIWADTSGPSPNRGTIYANWHTLGVPYLSRRVNGVWSPPVKLSGSETYGYAQGGDVRVDPAGTVYAFWPDNGAPDPASNAIWVTRSSDGGASFGEPVKAADLRPEFSFALAPSNINTRLVAPAVDRRGQTELAYVIWMDAAGGQACTNAAFFGLLFLSASSPCETRIWFSRSADGGQTWSAPASLFDPPGGNDQFNPSLAVDPTSGFLYATYHDTTGDPARVRTNLWMQVSKDRGVTWSAPVRLTEESSAGIWYGHYDGLAAGGGTVFPVWSSGDRSLGPARTWMAVAVPQP